MSGPIIGCDPTALSHVPEGIDILPPPQAGEITATLLPASARLYEGQSIADMADFAAMTAQSNFTSSAGPIADVTVGPLGDATDLTQALNEGQQAGFAVTVTDSVGTTETFSTAVQVVEFAARVIETVGNEAEIVVNDLVPDADVISFTLSGGTPYDGTYNATAGDLRADLFAIPGTYSVTYVGERTALASGATLTCDPGIWLTKTGILDISYEWLRNGVPIAGATLESYVLVVEDEGAGLSCRVNGSNGTIMQPVTTDDVVIPGDGLVVTQIYRQNATNRLHGIVDLSAVPEGATIYAAYDVRSSSGALSISGMTVDGAAADVVVQSPDAGRSRSGFFKFTRPANATPDIALTAPVTSYIKDFVLTLFHVESGFGEHAVVAAGSNSISGVDLNLNTVAGGVLLITGRDDGQGLGMDAIGAGTLTGIFELNTDDTYAYAITPVVADETPRAVRLQTPNNGKTHFSGAAICLI